MALASQMQRALRRQSEVFGLMRVSTSRWISNSHDHIDDEEYPRPATPWVRSVISGVDLMRNAKVCVAVEVTIHLLYEYEYTLNVARTMREIF